MSDREQHIVSQQHLAGQEKAAKPSRIPDQTIAFAQHAFSCGVDDRLDARDRIFLAHVVTKPHLTFRELAPFAGVGTAEGALMLWKRSIRALWLASAPEHQAHYPLADLLRRGQGVGIPRSPEIRARISEAKKDTPHSPKHRAHISEGQRKRWERRKQQPAEAHVIFDAHSRQPSPGYRDS
jgi:hypothetical protein